MWLDLLRQRVQAARIVRERDIDVPGVLFLQAVVKGHPFHYKERDYGGDADASLILTALGQNAGDLSLDEQVEGDVATPRFPCTTFMNRLRPVPRTRALVFTGEEIDLHLNRATTDHDGPVEDERLPQIGLVTAPKQQRLDRCVACLLKMAMVQGQIHVDAADVLLGDLGKDQLRNPSSDDNDVVAIFTEQPNQLKKNGPGRIDKVAGIVAVGYRHRGLMTSSKIAAAASSPRPLVCLRSR